MKLCDFCSPKNDIAADCQTFYRILIVTTHYALAASAMVGVSSYYFLVWWLSRQSRDSGSLVPLYQAPRELSPAMLRYVWKEHFDDRTFWAGVLSLVAKGLATLHSEDGATRLRSTKAANLKQSLPKEEQILLDHLVRGHSRRDVAITMLDPRTTTAITDMADSLRRDALGRWLAENRTYTIVGLIFSIIAMIAVAQPHNIGEWEVLVLGLAVMGPSSFYLFFLVLRVRDLIVAMFDKFDVAILRRAVPILALTLSCFAGIGLGAITLGSTFGWQFLDATLLLVVLNLMFLHRTKVPTTEGRKLLNEIEGFRVFLKSVERLPMQRPDEPGPGAGVYEKYLPYAVALEVEQAWSDKFVALCSTFHQNAGVPNAESFYLGMWDGKPVEVVYQPPPPRGRP